MKPNDSNTPPEGKKPETLEEHFEFFAICSGHDCCDAHRAAARRIFFSGFACCFSETQALAAAGNDAETLRILTHHREEIRRFALSLLEDKLRGVPFEKVPTEDDDAKPHGRN